MKKGRRQFQYFRGKVTKEEMMHDLEKKMGRLSLTEEEISVILIRGGRYKELMVKGGRSIVGKIYSERLFNELEGRRK